MSTQHPSSASSFLMSEEQLQMKRDSDWAHHNRELLEKHHGKIVVVYKEVLLGVGTDYETAYAEARKHPNCPEDELLAVAVPLLGEIVGSEE